MMVCEAWEADNVVHKLIVIVEEAENDDHVLVTINYKKKHRED